MPPLLLVGNKQAFSSPHSVILTPQILTTARKRTVFRAANILCIKSFGYTIIWQKKKKMERKKVVLIIAELFIFAELTKKKKISK